MRGGDSVGALVGSMNLLAPSAAYQTRQSHSCESAVLFFLLFFFFFWREKRLLVEPESTIIDTTFYKIVNLCAFCVYKLIGKLTAFFAASGDQLPEHDRGLFHFRHPASLDN